MKHIIGPMVLWLTLTTTAGRMSYAGNATSGGQWNIMVVPARQTVYSRQARDLFNQHCAACHSKDGRAQTQTARRWHVQDLSECKLMDDEIVEQILEGTNNKKNTFKMPAFKEKLTRAEVESLVPLVKAFRPASESLPDNQPLEHPRLAGIVSFRGRNIAVLEKVPLSGRYFLLAEGERHDGIELQKIKPEIGMVRLWAGGTNLAIKLKPDGTSSQPKTSKTRGSLREFMAAFSDAERPHRLALENANTDLVLFLYAQITGRTLLRSPRLPVVSFNLDVTGKNQAQIVLGLKSALSEKGITTIPDGNAFLLVAPASEALMIRPLSEEMDFPAGSRRPPKLYPGGVIVNFPNTEPSQVANFYADLIGRELDPTQPFPPSKDRMIFTTQTPLSTRECVYALETLFAWHGLKVVPTDGETIKFDLTSDTGR